MAQMINTLIDNSSKELSMQSYLRQCMNMSEITKIQIATGYWDIPGMALVVEELETFLSKEGTTLELLIGKDPYVYASIIKNPKYKGQNYPFDFIKTDINDLQVKEEYVDVVRLLITHLQSGKIKVRLYSHNEDKEVEFLHSKCYIFSGEGFSCGIIGSSNFTQKGLRGNAELNYLETDPTKITAEPKLASPSMGHIYWFNKKWALSTEWSKIFLEQILEPSKIAVKARQSIVPFTPYELYIKLLQIKFGDIVDQSMDHEIENYLPDKMHRLEYQLDAVKRCISIMKEHGGFMLADVVGLGKTIIGVLIVKHFLSSCQEDGREHKVLIVTPPAIQSGWKKTIKDFDRQDSHKISPMIDFITTGSIGKLVDDYEEDDDLGDSGDFVETLQDKNYGLILIDESHKFRNSNTNMYRSLDELIGRIGANTGLYPYIGLLSATPQNNKPDDLKNQIYLFQRNHNNSTLKKANGGDLEQFFSKVSREYQQLISMNSNVEGHVRKVRLNKISHQIRDCVLSDILERRTRTDVLKYYQEDLETQGLIFPEIVGPNNLEYRMDKELAQLFFDTMAIIAPTEEEKLQSDEWLNYYRYRAIEYFVDPENELKHTGRGNRGVSNVANQLANIMQIMLVKRLESSFAAFKKSLLNLRNYTQNMINMWDHDTIFICPQIDVNKELDTVAKKQKRGRTVTFEECIEDIRKKIVQLNKQGRNEKEQNAEYQRKDFKPEYYDHLKRDFGLVSRLCDRWAQNDEDPKRDEFRECLKPILMNPETNTSGKLVIFSEAIDTIDSLKRVIENKGYSPLAITAINRDEMEPIIQANFDANYEGEWQDDYDVIITTEVLAEGVNLHRANVILNYDTPWNSTKLMQRIGRVNRIGSKEPKVYIYNFMPSAEGDREIQLVRKAHTKIQSFHILFGEDSQIFTTDESVVHYDIAKAVDGEESPLQKYVYELKQYKEAHPKRYQQIAEATGDRWQIAQAEEGTAYFIIKAPSSAQLAITVGQDESNKYTTKVISLLEMLEQLQVSEEAKATKLPTEWKALTEQAIRAYNQYFVRIHTSRVGDKRTMALAAIVRLYESDISDESKELLKQVRRVVDRGSYDVIKKVLAIDALIQQRSQQLIPITQEEIDQLLETELAKLVMNVEQRQGKPMVLLGTMKE